MNKRSYNLRYRYGIDNEEYDRLHAEQDGICPVCKLPVEKGEGHVDHDHRTGKVRGILHPNCNTAIGKLDDDINKIKGALEYLNNHEDL